MASVGRSETLQATDDGPSHHHGAKNVRLDRPIATWSHFGGRDTAHNLADAIAAARDDEEAFIIGGAEIYQQALPLVDRIYLTAVEADLDGDARFPEFDRSDWAVIEHGEYPADERNDHPHTFTILQRQH